MKKALIFLWLLQGFSTHLRADAWIRINQLGYLPVSIKVAVFAGSNHPGIQSFQLVDARTDQIAWDAGKITYKGPYGPFTGCYRLDFSEFRQPGQYYILAGNTRSPDFRIDEGVYDRTADFLLRYMRQQRCGYNPYLMDSCHVNDGFIVYHPEKSGNHLDVTGGWHDATDYLQYTTTSANAVFQLLFAYRENPEAFDDAFQANGLPGSNGIPDVIDEAKWGMDWLLKMNPAPGEYYNQIADDRDHAGFRLPTEDRVVYDSSRTGRPVYFCTGQPQGLVRHQNRATGIASTAGKFSAAFALGADVLAPFFPEYAGKLASRASDAYIFGKQHPGVCQTAPGGAPYFYEEDNWVDDLELAAAELYRLTGNERYLEEAKAYGSQEPVTPWMGTDSARHYQWYPFLNAGHYEAAHHQPAITDPFAGWYQQGLDRIYQKGKENPFFMGVPFIWCSNNLITACVSQCKLYRDLTGDTTYLEMEAALRDWLFGCNPWGTSMIVGLPANSDSPVDPHSSLTHLYGYPTLGGLVDGPVYGSIFNRLIGLTLFDPDEYARFQSDRVVYHDDAGDYSTNEPTMDGTACLIYYLSSLESSRQPGGDEKRKWLYDQTGAVYRGDREKKEIALAFTGDEFADGGTVILETLRKYGIKASFFFTGNFYRNPDFAHLIRSLAADGHYLGPHSDRHLLVCDWTEDRHLLVSRDSFSRDLTANYEAMQSFGLTRESAPLFLPPYEWNNETITQWTDQMGLTLVNYTPGTLTHADYTTPDMKNYRSSTEIYQSVLEKESREDGLNGFILLSHIGSDPARTDKFYDKLDTLIEHLQGRGYRFTRIDEWMEPR